MSNYGSKIASYRKTAGMTQAELAEKLNISAQAVSKWENDLSEPDLETVKKLSEIFHVTVGEFLADEKIQKDASTENVKNNENSDPVVGVCCVCKKAVRESTLGDTMARGQMICKSCLKERQQKIVDENKKRLKESFWIAGIVALAWLIGSIWYTVTSSQPIIWIGVIIGTYTVFSFIAQLFWDGVVVDILTGSFKVIRAPGVIFDLSFDGIIFLIVAKLILTLACWLLGVLIFIGGAIIAMIIGMFTFPFALIRMKNESLKGEIL